ncbi:MlaD family protein [Marinimicrobium locisalis]|uniref:MlaD family protein n=1 Tax=Marinimicrobium locisalis TaxID=546022 RepID=UPI003221D873
MEPRAHHVLIGLFTVLAIGAALLFALWLGQATSDRDYRYYDIGFDRAVTGLAVGNAVLYSGIEVGDVVGLDFDPENPRRVLALIRVYRDIPITEDTTASLALANITGQMSIQLRGGDPGSPRLQSNRENPALIQAEPSPLSDLLANGETIITNINRLLENANRLLSDENTANLTRVIHNLKATTDTLAEQRGEITDGLAQFNRLMTEASQLTVRMNTLVDHQGRETLERANRTLATLEQLVNDNRGSLEQGLRGINDLGPALRELRSTLDSLQQLSRHLEEDPSDLLFGRDAIEEFNP